MRERMSMAPAGAAPRIVWLRSQLSTAVRSRGLVGNSVALSLGGALRLSVGFLTWVAAARLYPVGEVGLAASAISAMNLCAQVGILGVDLAVIRLYPSFARPRAELINAALTIAALGALVMGGAFLLVGAFGLHTLDALGADPRNAVLLLVLIVFQACWWVMDQTAVAMRRAHQVLARAAVDSIVTLAAVVALGVVGPATATSILLAWVVASAATFGVGIWQLVRSLPGYRPRANIGRMPTRLLLAVGLPNFALYAAETAPGLLLPLVAAEALGARAAAYWFAAWSMTTAVHMIPLAFGLNLFAAASAEPTELRRQVRHALRSAAALAVVAATLVVLIGPLVLEFLGEEYARAASGPLRILAVSALPVVVVKVYLAVCRATDRTSEGTIVALCIGVVSVALATAGAHTHGLDGMAIGWLIGQTAGAVVSGAMLVFLLRETPGRSAIGRRLSAVMRDARPLLPAGVHAVVPILIGAAWLAVMRSVPDRLQDMNDLGLVSVLPAGALALLGALTLSFCLALTRRPLRSFIPLLHVLVLIGILYGVTTLVEANPRLETVYRHAGVIDYLLRHPGVDPNIDAYFNWPGFFAFGALITDLCGFKNPVAFMAWGPLVFNLLFLAPLWATFRWASDDRRLTWLGLFVFYAANWVGQDYMSPQATGFALWLAIMAILLHSFVPPPRELAAGSRIASALRWVVRARLPVAEAPPTGRTALRSPGQRVGLLLLASAIFTAIVTGHQLTPFALILAVTGLVLLARLETRTLPVVLALITAGWVTFVATAYLKGNLSFLTSSVGSVGGNFNQTVTGRLQGSPEHLLVVQMRLWASAAIWGLGVLGFVRHLRAGRCNLALLAVGLTPFLLPILQPYGGEMFLRVFLFALPATAFFIAALVFPTERAGRSWLALGGVAVLLCGLLAAFTVTRYGNERLDHMSADDFQAVEYVYDHAAKGSVLIGGGSNLPWRSRDYETMRYQVIPDLDAWRSPCRGAVATRPCVREPDPQRVVDEMLDLSAPKGSWVIITESTKVQAALLNGQPGILEGIVDRLRVTPRAQEVLRSRDADVFRISPAPPGS